MKRVERISLTLRRSHFFLGSLILWSATALYGQNAPACGTILNSYKNIPAYSNGIDQWSDKDCDPGSTLPPMDKSGEQFQCTEYIKRFYSQALGIAGASQWTGDAIDYFSTAASKGLTAFANGGDVAPIADDILTFTGPNGIGHVAVVTSVSDPNGPNPAVTFIEQNWSIAGSSSLPYSKVCTSAGCSFTISDRKSIGSNGSIKAIFSVQGWLRATASVITNPTPSILSLSPGSVPTDSAAQTLMINGTGFVGASTVTLNSVVHAATFLNATQLTIPLTTADLATAGAFPVVVTNPGPGGGASNSASFTVTSGTGQVTITPASISILEGGVQTFTATVAGGGGVNWSVQEGSSGGTITNTGIYAAPNTVGTFHVIATNEMDSSQSAAASVSVTAPAVNHNEWTWMGGSNTAGAPAVYGTQGVASTSNIPGARDSAVTWTDPSGNFWLFGGEQQSGGTPDTNDLWKFNPATNEWTWVSGSNTTGSAGSYGTKGVASSTNVPPARGYGAASWTDQSGNLWLFGGYGDMGELNDLWEFNPNSKEWTWISGSNTADATSVYGTQGVASAANVPGARDSAVSWIDNSGNLWLFGGASPYVGAFNDLWQFSPTTKEWTWVGGSNTVNAPGVYGTLGVASSANIPGARIGAVSWTDSNGNLWLFGGRNNYSGFRNDLWKFNPATKEWTWTSGSSTAGAGGVYGTQGVASAANVPGARAFSVGWTDKSGNFWIFGGQVNTGAVVSGPNDLWKFNPATNEWTWVSGTKTVNGTGVYGTKGIPAATNLPGARMDSSGWIDNSGNLWLFGGFNVDPSGSYNELNDLWRYQP